jgi:hypothetical protein
MNRHQHRIVIDRLGGYATVANLLNVEPETSKKWLYRGIPSRHWHRIAALLPDITAEYLDRTRPARCRRRQR